MTKKHIDDMSFLDHLEDLRWHLIRATIGVLIAATAAFISKRFIFDVLLLGPSHSDFFTYDVLCKISQFIGMKESFCFDELPFEIKVNYFLLLGEYPPNC